MVSAVQFAVGIVGNVISMCLFFSPAPTFVRIYRTKTVGEYSAVPYIATLMNCLLWLFYGSPFVKMGVLVVTINGAGVIIQTSYLLIFLIYANDMKKLRNTLLMILAAILLYIVVVSVNMLAIDKKHDREVIVGILCVIVGTSMYISPLTIMGTVVRTKSTDYMPLPLSIFNLLNGIVWTTYALIGHDLFITIPNALGVLFAVCQLTLYICYCGASKRNQITSPKTPRGMSFVSQNGA
ncbi:hypothetical protein R1flu_001928 [Riccia fluitans]|uniref:Bidirectional sugar transporter SWEET n=1 Tax=Riccia fluitans TaxID=41844 RepID=A0ABD1Y4X4_9MARC